MRSIPHDFRGRLYRIVHLLLQKRKQSCRTHIMSYSLNSLKGGCIGNYIGQMLAVFCNEHVSSELELTLKALRP